MHDWFETNLLPPFQDSGTPLLISSLYMDKFHPPPLGLLKKIYSFSLTSGGHTTVDQQGEKTKNGISAPKPPRNVISVSKLRPKRNESNFTK